MNKQANSQPVESKNRKRIKRLYIKAGILLLLSLLIKLVEQHYLRIFNEFGAELPFMTQFVGSVWGLAVSTGYGVVLILLSSRISKIENPFLTSILYLLFTCIIFFQILAIFLPCWKLHSHI